MKKILAPLEDIADGMGVHPDDLAALDIPYRCVDAEGCQLWDIEEVEDAWARSQEDKEQEQASEAP